MHVDMTTIVVAIAAFLLGMAFPSSFKLIFAIYVVAVILFALVGK